MATARNAPWSRVEVEATAAAYFRMLGLELAAQPYNKRAHNRALSELLVGRTAGAIEMKHMNISAVLREMQFPHIAGYQPYGNWQGLLKDVVAGYLAEHPEFERLALDAVERIAVAPDIGSISSIFVDPPKRREVRDAPKIIRPRAATRRNYFELECRNRSLGLAGELFVADIEARRLFAGGHKNLADRVEHVSATRGDGLGYDVLSFDASGKERFIEVKTTAFSIGTPFYVSRNEIAFSDEVPDQFVLSRVHHFRSEPKLFELAGKLRDSVTLDAVTFIASF
jgi:Domain of unknown function (DUF3883)